MSRDDVSHVTLNVEVLAVEQLALLHVHSNIRAREFGKWCYVISLVLHWKYCMRFPAVLNVMNEYN